MRLFKTKKKMTSFQIITMGFGGVILLGALLLMLPISAQSGQVTAFSDALFTSVSAVCVTGLVVKDTATYWSYFGQAIILLLIQIGGLGVITVASLLAVISGKKIGLLQRQTIQNSMSAPQVGGVVKLTKFVFAASFVMEGIGFFLLLPFFCTRYGIEGIWMSFFHSISAFCNAGFDLMGGKSGEFSSLTAFSDSFYLSFVICLLILMGGLGFLTWNDLLKKKMKFKEYRLQTKIILVTTLVLVLFPFISFFILEYQGETILPRITKSLFQAITPRTAGFNTTDLMQMSEAGRTVMIILMLIGGSPGSTAGGMKTTTMALLFYNAISVFKMKKDVNCFGRRVEDSVIRSASTILFMYVSLMFLSASAISVLEDLPMEVCMFETTSAIATVGLTLGVTPSLGIISRMILIVLMFFGRVGGLTIIYATISPKDISASKYPVENIMVG